MKYLKSHTDAFKGAENRIGMLDKFVPSLDIDVNPITASSSAVDSDYRFYARRVNNVDGTRVSDVYVFTISLGGIDHILRYSSTSTPQVDDDGSDSTAESEFPLATVDTKFLFRVVPFSNTSTTTPTFGDFGESALMIQPYSVPADPLPQRMFLDVPQSLLRVGAPSSAPYTDDYFFFTNYQMRDGAVLATAANTQLPDGRFFTIRSVAKINSDFYYLTMYNDMGPTGPMENWEFEKGDYASAMLFRFLPRKKKGVSGSTVNTYDVQCKTTGLYLQQYRYTTRAADGSLVEHFAVSRTDTSDMETEMEIVQGDPNVLGAFKVRSYAYSNATREVFLRFDPSDPWTVHATTEQYNEATDGFEIYFREATS